MQDEAPQSPYGTNFENHPILSKLSTFDRIAFSAELSAEVNLSYAKGFNAALVRLGDMLIEVSKHGEGKFSDQTQATLLLVYNLVDRLNGEFLNLYKNQSTAPDPEENI